MKRIFLILLFITVVWFSANMPETPKDDWKEVERQDRNRIEPLTPTNVYNYLHRSNIRYADIAFRQILQETGHLTSWLCKEGNNLFGMTKTLTTTPPKLVYILYTNWKESVIAYKDWQDRHFNAGKNMSNYYDFLERIKYAKDTLYVNKLKRINIQKYIN